MKNEKYVKVPSDQQYSEKLMKLIASIFVFTLIFHVLLEICS